MLCTIYSEHIHMHVLLTETKSLKIWVATNLLFWRLLNFIFWTFVGWREFVSVCLYCSLDAGCTFWIFRVIEFEFYFLELNVIIIWLIIVCEFFLQIEYEVENRLKDLMWLLWKLENFFRNSIIWDN